MTKNHNDPLKMIQKASELLAKAKPVEGRRFMFDPKTGKIIPLIKQDE